MSCTRCLTTATRTPASTRSTTCAALRGLLSDLRESKVLDDRSIGELRGRDIEVALGRAGIALRRFGLLHVRLIEQMLSAASESDAALREFGAYPPIALAKIAELQQMMRDRVGYAAAPELQTAW